MWLNFLFTYMYKYRMECIQFKYMWKNCQKKIALLPPGANEMRWFDCGGAKEK